MKSVWIVKQYGSTPDLPGGVRQYHLARSLAARGYQVTFFLSRFHYLLRKDVRPEDDAGISSEYRDGIHLVWIRTTSYQKNDWRRAANFIDFAVRFFISTVLRRTNSKDIQPPDLVVANSLPLLAPLVAHRASRYLNAKFILEVSDLWPQTLFDMGKINESGSTATFLRWIERYLYRQCDQIISPLPNVAQYLSDQKIKCKVTYIGSGENISEFKPDDSDSVDPRHGFTIMYIGAHGPANHLYLALQAMQHLASTITTPIRLVLVGEGSEKKELQRKALHMKLDNVTFRDAVPKSKIPEIVRQADAFLLIMKDLPIYRYGINLNKLVDYFCAGRPVVFAGKVINDLVKENKCGISIKPDDPIALAEAIAYLAHLDQGERKKMGKAARRLAEQHFDTETVTDRFLEAVGYR